MIDKACSLHIWIVKPLCIIYTLGSALNQQVYNKVLGRDGMDLELKKLISLKLTLNWGILPRIPIL